MSIETHLVDQHGRPSMSSRPNQVDQRPQPKPKEQVTCHSVNCGQYKVETSPKRGIVWSKTRWTTASNLGPSNLCSYHSHAFIATTALSRRCQRHCRHLDWHCCRTTPASGSLYPCRRHPDGRPQPLRNRHPISDQHTQHVHVHAHPDSALVGLHAVTALARWHSAAACEDGPRRQRAGSRPCTGLSPKR